MKKLFLSILVICSLLGGNVNAKILETFCLINLFDVRKDNLSREDQQRFAGKEIHLLINFDENSIMDISEDTGLSIITGMYGPEDKKSFTINNSSISYKNEIIVNDEKEGGTLTYSYDNQVRLTDDKPTKLISNIDQTGITFNKWSFKINCRDQQHSFTEKNKAFSGADVMENTMSLYKEMLNKQEEEERKKNIPIIEDLTNYKVNNYDDLLFLYKVKFFNNKINAGIELNTGNTIYFENVKEMDETEFFKLPVKGKGQIMKKRKLKKEFLEKKKNL
jgi:archaellin